MGSFLAPSVLTNENYISQIAHFINPARTLSVSDGHCLANDKPQMHKIPTYMKLQFVLNVYLDNQKPSCFVVRSSWFRLSVVINGLMVSLSFHQTIWIKR